MRLINCQIENIRVHSKLFVEFSPGITLIGGPNETGKSTLIEALHKAFFLKATSTGLPIEILRSRLHLGQPIVNITFEAQEDIYNLKKCFSGSTGQITLNNQNQGTQLSGDVAEESLAKLLGLKETIGSRQANSKLTSRWAHLWVLQGSSSSDILKLKKESYDCESLVIQLQRSGGAAIQQSENDQHVAKLIDEAIDANFTSRGIKKNSILWARKQELKEAQLEAETAYSTQKEYEKASEDLIIISQKINDIDNKLLPSLINQKSRILEDSDNIKKIQNKLKFAIKELEPLYLKYKSISKVFNDINNITNDIIELESKCNELHTNQSNKETKIVIIDRSIKTKHEIIIGIKEKIENFEIKKQSLNLLLNKLIINETCLRLKNEINSTQRNIDKRHYLQKKINSLSKINRAEIRNIRDLKQFLRDIETRQMSMETVIKVIRSNKSISINGKSFEAGEERSLNKIFQIKIGDEIILEVTPGGAEALRKQKTQYSSTKKKITEILAYYGVESIETAEKQFEERLALEQQLNSLENLSNIDIQEKKIDLDNYELKSIELENELLNIAKSKENIQKEIQYPNGHTEINLLLKEVQKNLIDITKLATENEKELETLKTSFQELSAAKINEINDLKILKNSILDRQKRLISLEKDYGKKKALTIQIDSIKEELRIREAEVTKFKKQLHAFQNEDKNQILINIQDQIQTINEEKEQLIIQKGAALSCCNRISSNDPYAAVERSKVQLETIKDDFEAIQRTTNAHILLKELFQNVQADLSKRYTEPLAQTIDSYLRPLIPNGPITQLKFDNDSGFNGLQMREGEELYEFEHLSGGMKEQLSAALRLSMADVLKKEHNGCLPLVFDDTFTNSDPKRLIFIKTMLKMAADRGLQVILLTCKPSEYDSFADQVITLKSMIK